VCRTHKGFALYTIFLDRPLSENNHVQALACLKILMDRPTKKVFYYLFRIFFWLCITGISCYLFLSIALYLAGSVQFSNFQSFVFSHPAVFFVPVFVTFSLFALKFLRDRNEEMPKQSSTPFRSIMVVISLVSVGAWYIRHHHNSSKENSNTGILISTIATNTKNSVPLPEDKHRDNPTPSAIENRLVESPSNNKKTASLTPEKMSSDDTVKANIKDQVFDVHPEAVSEHMTEDVPASVVDKEKYAVTEVRYKVISKAYFHDQPDESTRRNAFINHWNNSYATLNPLREKNGFIYVVFTNQMKQVSYGWLLKKDLRALTTKVYEDSK
jgi:hypothetical protein